MSSAPALHMASCLDTATFRCPLTIPIHVQLANLVTQVLQACKRGPFQCNIADSQSCCVMMWLQVPLLTKVHVTGLVENEGSELQEATHLLVLSLVQAPPLRPPDWVRMPPG
jgi:hypothetical protein